MLLRFDVASLADGVDCSRKKPKQPVVFKQIWYDKRGDEWSLLVATGIPAAQCNWYFFYYWRDDAFVTPQRWKNLHRISTPSIEKDLCVVRVIDDDYEEYIGRKPEWESQVCSAPKGGNVWKYAGEYFSGRCRKRLCHYAMTGEWKAKGLFNHAKTSPWHATEPDEGSYGYVQAFHQKCAQGPPAFGDLLGSFSDFAEREKVITPDGTFNKTLCGCKTADDCREERN